MSLCLWQVRRWSSLVVQLASNTTSMAILTTSAYGIATARFFQYFWYRDWSNKFYLNFPMSIAVGHSTRDLQFSWRFDMMSRGLASTRACLAWGTNILHHLVSSHSMMDQYQMIRK